MTDIIVISQKREERTWEEEKSSRMAKLKEISMTGLNRAQQHRARHEPRVRPKTSKKKPSNTSNTFHMMMRFLLLELRKLHNLLSLSPALAILCVHMYVKLKRNGLSFFFWDFDSKVPLKIYDLQFVRTAVDLSCEWFESCHIWSNLIFKIIAKVFTANLSMLLSWYQKAHKTVKINYPI